LLRSAEIECIRRFLAHLRDGTTDHAPAPRRVPASAYTSPERCARERLHLLRQRPIVVGLSADLPRTGSYFCADAGGLPLVVTRHPDGRVRAFVNACRHRGGPVASGRGGAEGGRLRCAFHAWTYALDGSLAALPLAEEGFAALDRSRLGLRECASAEADGLILVRAEGGDPIDAEAVLRGAGDDLRALGLASYHHFETRTAQWRCNWKLLLETFLESYHVFSLHRESVHPWYFSQPMVHDAWEASLRFPVARRSLETLAQKPEAEWRLADHATLQWWIAPNALVSHTRDIALLWRFSSPSPGCCDVATSFYSARACADEADAARLREAFDLQLRVTGAEDFPMGERIQGALDAGAVPELNLGRNEVGVIHFHRTLDALLETASAAEAAR
jgi:phenylpropionate dioxygenase-like ring-hydroxylating dioxygenase large terminal subunit